MLFLFLEASNEMGNFIRVSSLSCWDPWKSVHCPRWVRPVPGKSPSGLDGPRVQCSAVILIFGCSRCPCRQPDVWPHQTVNEAVRTHILISVFPSREYFQWLQVSVTKKVRESKYRKWEGDEASYGQRWLKPSLASCGAGRGHVLRAGAEPLL